MLKGWCFGIVIFLPSPILTAVEAAGRAPSMKLAIKGFKKPLSPVNPLPWGLSYRLAVGPEITDRSFLVCFDILLYLLLTQIQFSAHSRLKLRNVNIRTPGYDFQGGQIPPGGAPG